MSHQSWKRRHFLVKYRNCCLVSRELAEVRQALQSLQQQHKPHCAPQEQRQFDQLRLHHQQQHRLPNLGISSVVNFRTTNANNNRGFPSLARNRSSTSSGNSHIVHCHDFKGMHYVSFLFLGSSSIENKYETIEKSLSPYKIMPDEIPENEEAATKSPHVRQGCQKVQVRANEISLLMEDPCEMRTYRYLFANSSSSANSKELSSILRVGTIDIIMLKPRKKWQHRHARRLLRHRRTTRKSRPSGELGCKEPSPLTSRW